MKQSYKKGLMLSALLLLCSITMNAEQMDTVYYQNKTVSGVVYVKSNDAIISNNVTVSNTGQLNLTANTTVNITPSFVVNLGGVLNINTGVPPRIRYTYDASGNRTRRETDNE